MSETTPSHTPPDPDELKVAVTGHELVAKLKQLTEKPAPEKDLPRGLLALYVLSFSLIGFATGILAGLSRSPVVSTLLPLLFGLLGGAGSLYLSQTAISPQRSLAVTAGSIALTVLVLIGAAIGISIRTRTPLVGILPRWEAGEPVGVVGQDQLAKYSPATLVHYAQARARVRALPVSDAERRFLLEQAQQAILAPPPLSPLTGVKVFTFLPEGKWKELAEVAMTAQKACLAASRARTGAEREEIIAVAHGLEILARRIEGLMTITPGDGVPLGFQEEVANSVLNELRAGSSRVPPEARLAYGALTLEFEKLRLKMADRPADEKTRFLRELEKVSLPIPATASRSGTGDLEPAPTPSINMANNPDKPVNPGHWEDFDPGAIDG